MARHLNFDTPSSGGSIVSERNTIIDETRTLTNKNPRALNVLLISQGDGRTYDLNKAGLISMTFDRYLSNTRNLASGILQTIDITMFDKEGQTILSLIQNSGGKLSLQYGFENDLSPVYHLNIVRVRANRSDVGTAISLGGIGQEYGKLFPAEIYKEGTSINDILNMMAKRNNWVPNVSCDIKLSRPLMKNENQTDFDFIYRELLPVANQSLLANTVDAYSTVYWNVQLFKDKSNTKLVFQPKNVRAESRRVWQLKYGLDNQTNIINFNQDINLTHLTNGLTIKISSDALEVALASSGVEDFKAYIDTVIVDLADEIEKMHRYYNIPVFAFDGFKWNVELVDEDVEGVDYTQDLKTRVKQAINQALSLVNTATVDIIGNPEIKPNDLVELLIKTKKGDWDFLTTPAGNSTFWNIRKITENIGANGYTTTLHLVREMLI